MTGRRTTLFLTCLICLALSGCSWTTPQQNNLFIDVSNMEAIPLSINQNVQDTEVLLEEGVIVKKESILNAQDKDLADADCFALETVVRNKDYEFLRTSYSEVMAQFPYRNQIYMSSLQQDNKALIYDTSEAYWINEMRANDNYLYWLEHLNGETDICYRVMQYQLDSGKINCIAERNGGEVFEPCMEVSDRFLTWYDIFRDGSVETTVFDIEKQEFMARKNIEDITGGFVTLYGPYERLKLVDDCITYFLENEEGRLYVRRENLCTGQTSTLSLGDKKQYRKLAGCFSDQRYIGWHTEYGWGNYYFYDMDKGELYSWDVKKDEMCVFSKFFSSGRLYINNSEDDSVYAWELDKGQIYRQGYGDGTGMQFGQFGEGQLDLEVRFDDRVELLTLCEDGLFFE
ncbi:MAG: hypothetical protein K2O34_02780 [Acetatifactor sp.]|nr:hypothetical protein [Acetatifactor sp.]